MKASDVAMDMLTATIRVLTVGPRAMTISMFAQLDVLPLFDELGGYLGKPWGRVNHAAACEQPHEWERQPARHAHVVWEREGALLKCCIRREPAEVLLAPFRARQRLYEELMLIARARDEKPEYDLNERGDRLVAVRWPDYAARRDYGFEPRFAFALGQPDSLIAKAEIQHRLVTLDDRPSDAWTYYEAQAHDAERGIDRLRSTWRKRFEECLRLPLLIIGTTPKEDPR